MKIVLPALLFCSLFANAQVDNFLSTDQSFSYSHGYYTSPGKRKLFQRNTGMIIGLQKGRNTLIEFGGEAHWRKISLLKPHIIGATANMEYNFADHVLGYKAGLWMKRGRINLTYGANAGYYTDFKNGNRFGFGPSVGFRFFGLHVINGFTLLTKDNSAINSKTGETSVPVNTLYMSLRYYFPVENKFTWDRKTMKKKKARKKEQSERKRERIKKADNNKSKRFWDILKPAKKDSKK